LKPRTIFDTKRLDLRLDLFCISGTWSKALKPRTIFSIKRLDLG
ncbi:9059_t:CDS:1, partial [Diversispora eburnea]